MNPGMVSGTLLDTAVDRLLHRGAQVSALVELQLLKAENARLKAELGAVQAEDDKEIERLWGAIEDLEVQLALARQAGGRQPPSRQELVYAAGDQPSIEELGRQVAALSQQLHLFSDTLGLLQPSVQHHQVVDGPVVSGLPAGHSSLVPSHQQGQHGGTSAVVLGPELQAQIDSSIRAQLQQALPDLRAEIRAVLGGALLAPPIAGAGAGELAEERAAEAQPTVLSDDAATRQPAPLPAGAITQQQATLLQPLLAVTAPLGSTAAGADAAPLSDVVAERPAGNVSTQPGGTTDVLQAAQRHAVDAVEHQDRQLVCSQQPSEPVDHPAPAVRVLLAAGAAGAYEEALGQEVGGLQAALTATATAASQPGEAADLASRGGKQQPPLPPQRSRSAEQEAGPQDGLQTGPPPGWLGKGALVGEAPARSEPVAQEVGHATAMRPSHGPDLPQQQQQEQRPGQGQQQRRQQQQAEQHGRPGSAASWSSGAQSGGRVSFSLGIARKPASVFDRLPSPGLAIHLDNATKVQTQQAQHIQHGEGPQRQHAQQQGPVAKRLRVEAAPGVNGGLAPAGAAGAARAAVVATNTAKSVPAAPPAAAAIPLAGKPVPGQAAPRAPGLGQAAAEAAAPKQAAQPDSTLAAKVGSAAAVEAGQTGRRGGQQGQGEGGRARQPSPSVSLLTSGFMAGAVPSSMTASDLEALPRICPPCGITLPGQGEYLQHLSSSEHWRRLTALCRMVEGLTGKATLTKKERQAFDKAQAQNWPCFACGMAITSASGFLKHMEGSKHFATVSSFLRSLAAGSVAVPSQAAAEAAPVAPSAVQAADEAVLAPSAAAGGPGAGPDHRSVPVVSTHRRQAGVEEQQGLAGEGSQRAAAEDQQQQQQRQRKRPQAQPQQPQADKGAGASMVVPQQQHLVTGDGNGLRQAGGTAGSHAAEGVAQQQTHQQQRQQQDQQQQQQPLLSQPVLQDQRQARKHKYQWHRAQAQPQAQAQHPQQSHHMQGQQQQQRQGDHDEPQQQKRQHQGKPDQPQQQQNHQEQRQQQVQLAQPQQQQNQQPWKAPGREPALATKQAAAAASTHAAAPGQKRTADAAGLASQGTGGKQKGSSGKSQAKASGEGLLGGAAVGVGPAAGKGAGATAHAADIAMNQGARPESERAPRPRITPRVRHSSGSNTVPLGARAVSGSEQLPAQQAQQPTKAAGAAVPAAATAALGHAEPGPQQAARATSSRALPSAPLVSGQAQAGQCGVATGSSRPGDRAVKMVGPPNAQAGDRGARGMGSGGGPLAAGDEEEVEEGELLLPQYPPGFDQPAAVHAPPRNKQLAAAHAQAGMASSQLAAPQAKPAAKTSRPAALKFNPVVQAPTAKPAPQPGAIEQVGPFPCSFCLGVKPFPTLIDYLKHIRNRGHKKRVEVALQNLEKGMKPKKVLISKQHQCYACNVQLPYYDFLKHLLSDKHAHEVNVLRKQANLVSELSQQQGEATVEDDSEGANAEALPRTVLVGRRGQGRLTGPDTALGMAAMEQQWPGNQGMMGGQLLGQGAAGYLPGQMVGHDMLSSQLQGQPGFFAGPMLRPMSLPMMMQQQLEPTSLPMMQQAPQLLPGLGMPLLTQQLMRQQQLMQQQQQVPPWVQDRMLLGMWPPF